MGQDVEQTVFSGKDRQRYRAKVRRCLDVFSRMLSESKFDVDRPMTGLEIEFNLVDPDHNPAMRNADVLEAIADDSFQTELGQFNIEINVPPRPLGGSNTDELERDLRASLNAAEEHAKSVGTHIVMIGMLPTLYPEHLTHDSLSANPRYALINEQIFDARGEDIHINIDGVERLATSADTIAPEAACTSVQFHLQVSPQDYARTWNAAQCIAGVQVALGANSPFLFGKELWRETRIALFEQATDTRPEELKAQGVRPRVWFGERWITSIFDQFEENVRLIDNNGQGWRSIFARDPDKLFNAEWVWFLPFSENFAPQDPFIDLFSNRGGSYLLKPSQVAMNNWNSQTQKNNFTYDARGKVFSYRMLDGQPVIMKYLYNYLDGTTFMPTNLLIKKGKWHLYRAAALHLEFAEAANLDNHHALAYAIINQGLTTIPNKITGEGNPYDFDARKSDVPKIAADWYQNAGVRGRAYLYSNTAPIVGDSTLPIEDQIVNEGGLELAYEGKRWSDLVRVALRRNDPSYLANKVYAKLLAENNPKAATVRAKLMTVSNWYLPFKWQ